MGHYYFDVIANGFRQPDGDGLDAPDQAAVDRMVAEAARELMSDAIMRGEDISHHAFEVRDEGGTVVLSFPFGNAIKRNI